MTKDIKKRSEVSEEFKWKISDLCESDEKWESLFSEAMNEIKKIGEYKGKIQDKNNYKNFGKTLLNCLKAKDKAGIITETVYVYANLRANEDSGNSKYQAMSGRADTLITAFSSESAFIEPELLEVPENEIKKALSENSELKIYEHYLMDILRSKEHILPAEQEDILARVYEIAQAPDNIFGMLNNADLKFDDIKDEKGNLVPMTHGKYISYLESPNREIRKQAFESCYKAYLKQKNTLAAIYVSSVKKDVFFANVRKYPSSLEASLFSTNIPVSVYHNLIAEVNKHLPLMHRYINIRKKKLKLDELHMYDIYAPIVKDANTKMDYDKAKEIVIKALQPMGDEYVSQLKKGLSEGWIDIYENEGKRSGAYAWGAYGNHPYVSLNYDGTINSMFTLAHEMGHAMHSHYTWSNQPYVYGDYTIFVAEVASTVNEALLMEYLLKTTDDENGKNYLINYFLEQFRGTLFRQTMFAEFELITHELTEKGETLTYDRLCEIYRDLNIKYFGENIVIDHEIDREWARIPHFYNAFYVYQYATGYSAAIALSQKILKENGARDYIEFLKGGSSKYSIDLLKTAGVDMSDSKPIEEAMSVFKDLLDKIE